MKDGRTHLAHKAEHAVDMETGAIVGVTVQGADQGDTTTIAETLTAVTEDLEAVAAVTADDTGVINEVVADKGYHSNQVLTDSGGPRPAGLHRGTGSRPTQLDEERRGPRCGLCESATHPRYTGRGLAAATERAPRRAERASVRHRRHATYAPARACQHPQATARPHGGVQLGPAHANADRRGHAARPPGTCGGGPDTRRRTLDTSHRLLVPFRQATHRSHVRMSDAGSLRTGPRRRVRMGRLTTGC